MTKRTSECSIAKTGRPSLHAESARTAGIVSNGSDAPLLLVAAAVALETQSEQIAEK
jgi:hypothetical protein